MANKLIHLLCTVVFLATLSGCGNKSGKHPDETSVDSCNLNELFRNGCMYSRQEQTDSAVSVYLKIRESSNKCLSDSDAVILIKSLTNLGYIYHFQYHEYSKALMYYLEGMELCTRYGLDAYIPTLLLNIGGVYWIIGSEDKTYHLYKKALYTSLPAKQSNCTYISILNLLSIDIDNQRYNNPEEYISAYERVEKANNDTLAEIARLYIDGYRLLSESRPQEAEAQFDSIINIKRIHPTIASYVINAKQAKAASLWQQGKFAHAVELLENTIKTYSNDDAKYDLSYIYRTLAKYYEQAGEHDLATKAWLEFYRINYEKKGSSVATGIADVIKESAEKKHQEKISLMELRHRNYVQMSAIIFISLSGIAGLLWFMYHNQKRKRQLMQQVYQNVMARVPGEGSVTGRMADDSDESLMSADTYDNDCPVYTQPPISDRHEPGDESDISKNDIADIENLKIIYSEINKTMSSCQEVYKCDFSLHKLAEIMEMPIRSVSRAINEVGHRNFATLLAEYRIAKVCRILDDKDAVKQYSMSAIAESVGFRSRTNFTSVFKKITGLTPTEFQKSSSKPKQLPFY